MSSTTPSGEPFIVLIEFQTPAGEQELLADLAADRVEERVRHRPGFLWTRIWRDEDGTGFWWMTAWKDRAAYEASIRDEDAQAMMRQILKEGLRPRTTFLILHKSLGAS